MRTNDEGAHVVGRGSMPMVTAPTVSFIVPSYKRLDALQKGLERILTVSPAPLEVIVLFHDDDPETDALARSHGVTTVEVPPPGQVASLLAGYAHAKGEILAVLDDDAVPDREWLERCLRHFEDPAVGLVGGRDRVYLGDSTEPLGGPGHPVGLLRNWGNLIGNHHSGTGEARQVDHVKGCNYVVRANCVRRHFSALDVLKGNGAQMANDTAVSLSVRAAGWRVMYDPQAQVAHYPGDRPSGDHRLSADAKDVYVSSYNETLMRLAFVPARWLPVAIPLAVVWGSGHAPGALRSIVDRLRGRPTAGPASLAAIVRAVLATPGLRKRLSRETASARAPAPRFVTSS